MRSPPVPLLRPPSQASRFGLAARPEAQPRITRVTSEKLFSAAFTWALKQPEQPPVRRASVESTAFAGCPEPRASAASVAASAAIRLRMERFISSIPFFVVDCPDASRELGPSRAPLEGGEPDEAGAEQQQGPGTRAVGQG